jgi:tetratricopeptide (TPR) repeat protein
MDLLMNELREVEERFHPTFIYWMDNLTMGSKGYCKTFCEALINEKFGFRYFITGRVDHVDREVLRLLKDSGCVCILYGLESANNELLKFMNKNITVEQFVEAIRLTKEAGIGVNISAMFGQPGETIQDFYNTLNLILTSTDRKMPYSNNQGFYPLTTFPGSPIYQWAKENGYIKSDDDYYDQFFEKRWINYTQYPRDIVEKVLNVANLLNTWNFHYNKALSLEDFLFYLQTISSSKIPVRRIAFKVKDYIDSKPKFKQSLKRVIESRPWLKWIIMKLLGRDTGKTSPSNPQPIANEDRTDNLKTALKVEIDPKWDCQMQVDIFIDLLVRRYFLSGGEENVQLREEAGRLAGLAKAFFDKKDYDEAIKYYKMVLGLTPEDSNMWGELGWAYQYKMRFDEAVKSFNKGVELNSTNQVALRGLGWAYYQKSVFDMAIKHFNKALENIDMRERDLLQETYRGSAWSYYNTEKYELAIRDFDRAIENTNPSDKNILDDLLKGRTLAFSAKNRAERE